MALVVTIIVMLILAGITLNLTIGDNGIFKRAENAVSTWKNAESNEQIVMGEMSNLIEDYSNKNIDGIIWHGDVPIPIGFYYVGGEKDTGLIISDNSEDENKGVDYPTSSFKGNQFVWVPVANPENYFIDETAVLNTRATGTGAENEVITNVYSNLSISSGEDDIITVGKPGNEGTEDEKVARELDILSNYDTDEQHYKTILGFNNPREMAERFVVEYKAMSDSVKKYKCFYIGRYELTGTVEDPTEKAGISLVNQNWYNLYKACQNVVTGNSNVKSTMIYGVQWDAVCNWLEQSGFDTNSDSSSWGNYKPNSGNGYKVNTGSNKLYEANKIFDFAGNCSEWTQEAYSNYARFSRGGYCNNNKPVTDRGSLNPDDLWGFYSSRATLYIE